MEGNETWVIEAVQEIALVAELISIVTPEGKTRYMHRDTLDYTKWAFQTQLADFLNKCLDNPIVP